MLSLLLLSLLLHETPTRVKIAPQADALHVQVSVVLSEAQRRLCPQGVLSQEQGEGWLPFSVVDAETNKPISAMLGSYEEKAGVLYFTPKFTLSPAQLYRATFLGDKATPTTADYRTPARTKTPAPRIEQVYPTAEVLPANHLKFYVHFSRPMRESREVFDYFSLVDEQGKAVHDPWRRTELWSADAKRLTLWVHPGRIKTGVNLREQLGPVLEPDRKYRFVISADLRAADGEPLGVAYTKSFRTSGAVSARIDLSAWKVAAPKPGTTEPVVYSFPLPLDRAMLEKSLSVHDAQGRAVPGRLTVGKEERSWSFQPTEPWQAATYTLKVDGLLEDLAGNTPAKRFDVDLTNVDVEPVKLTLEFKPS